MTFLFNYKQEYLIWTLLKKQCSQRSFFPRKSINQIRTIWLSNFCLQVKNLTKRTQCSIYDQTNHFSFEKMRMLRICWRLRHPELIDIIEIFCVHKVLNINFYFSACLMFISNRFCIF